MVMMVVMVIAGADDDDDCRLLATLACGLLQQKWKVKPGTDRAGTDGNVKSVRQVSDLLQKVKSKRQF